MIIAVDCETQGLDASKFVQGCLIKESGKTEIFYNKNIMWQYIKELAKKERKRQRILTIYAHNHEYDFYAYANLNDKGFTIHCTRPFIATYSENGQEMIKFLDTLGIYKMSLSKAGKLINQHKLDTPEFFKTGEPITKQQLIENEEYIKQDTKLVLELIKELKEQLAKDNIRPNRIYTISQVAISYLTKKLAEKPREYLFEDYYQTKIIRTKYEEDLHQAYRIGRTEAFQKGTFQNVTYIDCNSKFPDSARKIRFPDMRTERKIKEPVEIYENRIFDKIGISKVLLKNETDQYCLIPVRQENGNYNPEPSKYALGIYSNDLIKKALEVGWKLIQCEYSIIYDDAPDNPLKEITEEMYKKRKNAKTEKEKWYWKQFLNRSYGKLGQRNKRTFIEIDTIEKHDEYIKNGYVADGTIGYNYIYKKEVNSTWRKKYYCPIIPVLITSDSIIDMYNEYNKIPLKDLLYSDTDSIIFKGNHLNKFKLGKEMGEFKIEKNNEKELINTEAIIYGRKTLSVGDKISISGTNKTDLEINDFKKGIVSSRRMNTIKTSTNQEIIGSFTTQERDLKEVTEEQENYENTLKERNIYIDKDLKNINYFINTLNREIKWDRAKDLIQ